MGPQKSRTSSPKKNSVKLYFALFSIIFLGCKHEIKQHCPSENEINGILHCLKEAKSDVNFDRNCKLIVSRRTRQQAKDYR